MLRVLILLVLLSSCSAERHLAKAKKHIEIAKSKGAVIVPDSVWYYSYDLDTVYNVSNNSYETKLVLKDSFPYLVTNTIKTYMSRQERLAIRDQFKHLERMIKLQNDSIRQLLKYQYKNNKQNKKTDRTISRKENKSNPWAWVSLAAIALLTIIILKYGKSRTV